MSQALSSIDIGSLICNVGAGGGGGAPAGAPAAGAAAATAGDAPGNQTLGSLRFEGSPISRFCQIDSKG